MSNECDKCRGKIFNGKCPCGFWYEKDEVPNLIKAFERAIYAYDYICEQHNDSSPFTGDHHSGNCIVLFKGNYEDVVRVKRFILEMNNVG